MTPNNCSATSQNQKEEKVNEKPLVEESESSDDDMGFGLFDWFSSNYLIIFRIQWNICRLFIASKVKNIKSFKIVQNLSGSIKGGAKVWSCKFLSWEIQFSYEIQWFTYYVIEQAWIFDISSNEQKYIDT